MRRQHRARRHALLAGDDYHDMDLVFAGPTGEIRDRLCLDPELQEPTRTRGARAHSLARIATASSQRYLQDQGVPLERIRDLIGHCELRVTESYAYTLPDSLKSDMEAITRCCAPPMEGSGEAPLPNRTPHHLSSGDLDFDVGHLWSLRLVERSVAKHRDEDA